MKRSPVYGMWFVPLAVLAALAWSGNIAAQEAEEEEVVTEVPVRVGKIVRATLRGYVVAYGKVELEPPSPGRPPATARIATPVPGIIAEVKCAEGQRVAKGDILFQLDSRVADVAVEKAQKAVEFAEQNLARQKKLQQVEGTSKKLYEEAEQQLHAARADLAAAKTQRELLTIRAPLAGTVMRVNVNPGEAVDLTSVLAELTDLDRLVVTADVPSREIPLLKTGQQVEFSTGTTSIQRAATALPADPAASTSPLARAEAAPSTAALSARTGTLIFIRPQIDPQTDTVQVRASVPAGSGLRLGQFVRIRICHEERKDRLAVPKDSIVTDASSSTLIAVVENDKAVKKPVKVGLREDNLVEIEGEGLTDGMTIVTEGAYGLPTETKIRVIGQ
ncbi:MAG: efflux RND transporter periplasmic adaptor subunit [Candidatus Sumerlaeia bacterium]|nr:efflux RND transporter periplasmic adaptor subunit [Candidatus Sumerlaeia bacterium]